MKNETMEHMYLLGLAKYGGKNPDPLSGVDIEKEYKLIQEKKSGLTTRLRDMVMARHNALREEKKGV